MLFFKWRFGHGFSLLIRLFSVVFMLMDLERRNQMSQRSATVYKAICLVLKAIRFPVELVVELPFSERLYLFVIICVCVWVFKIKQHWCSVHYYYLISDFGARKQYLMMIYEMPLCWDLNTGPISGMRPRGFFFSLFIILSWGIISWLLCQILVSSFS